MSKQATIEQEATELQKETRGHTTPSAEDEIYQSWQMDHEDTIEPKTNKDESVAFELIWSMKLNDHTDNVNKLLATHTEERVPSSELNETDDEYDPLKTLLSLSG